MRTAILISENLVVNDDVFTSIHIQEFEVLEVRDTKSWVKKK